MYPVCALCIVRGQEDPWEVRFTWTTSTACQERRSVATICYSVLKEAEEW